MEYYKNYDYDELDSGYGRNNYIGDQMVPLEHKSATQTITASTWITVSGGRDPFRGIERLKFTTTQNKYMVIYI